MRKVIIYFSCFMFVLLLAGCSMNNTPTKRVESFLDSYKHHDKNVLDQLNEMVDADTLMNDTQRKDYTGALKRQYKDLTYDIKDETIDGDNATVTVELEVYDFYKVNKESEDYYNNNPNEFVDTTDENATNNNTNSNGVIGDAVEGVKDAANNVLSDAKYITYRIANLGKATDRIKYTVDFTLRKENNEWKLNDIDDATRQKIHGLYAH